MDKLELYRWAVQDPETHAIVLGTIFERLRHGRQPLILREDFAGTSAESVAWVALRRGRRAIAVDIDQPTIEWARRRASRLLGASSAAVQFVTADALTIGPPEIELADIIAVLNFSMLYLRERDALEAYLQQIHRGLSAMGVLVFNILGGSENTRPTTTSRHVAPRAILPGEMVCPEFDYLWEVCSFDPPTSRLHCRIHFTVPDVQVPGQTHEIVDAFQYDWRLWSLSELIESCQRAGYSQVQIWRHTYDASLGNDGVFLGSVDPESLRSLPAWTAYVVACR